jgi:hypothetical protein
VSWELDRVDYSKPALERYGVGTISLNLLRIFAEIVITGVFFVSILRFSRSIGRNSRISPIALTRVYW